jgi:hypothetical protein
MATKKRDKKTEEAIKRAIKSFYELTWITIERWKKV